MDKTLHPLGPPRERRALALTICLLFSLFLSLNAQSDEPLDTSHQQADTPAAQISPQDSAANNTPHVDRSEHPIEQELDDPTEQALMNTMGYEWIDTPRGRELVYRPEQDQYLDKNFRPSPIIASYLDIQKRQTHELFNHFVVTQLTPVQRKLLWEYIISQLVQSQTPGADDMVTELQNDELSPQSAAYITRIIMALYYYHTYVYEPLINYADNVTTSGQEGLVMPHIIAMSQHLVSQFPNSAPFSNILLIAPVVTQLFYRHYQNGQTSMALAASSYAALLGLAAQFSAGILGKYTSFNSYSAGMLASSWRNFQHRYYMQAIIDGTFTMLHLQHKRGLIYAGLGAAFMHAMKLPRPEWPGARYADANHMLPLILSVCLTHDWLSSFITGATLLFNQYGLYQPRDLFLKPGQIYSGNEPYWPGLAGAGVAALATTLMYWNEMPTLKESGETVSTVLHEASDWLNYLSFMKGTVRPDQERSGILQTLTRHYNALSPYNNQYHGERSVITEHNFGSRAEALMGNSGSSLSSLSEWMSWFMGQARHELPKEELPHQTSALGQSTEDDSFTTDKEALIEDLFSDEVDEYKDGIENGTDLDGTDLDGTDLDETGLDQASTIQKLSPSGVDL